MDTKKHIKDLLEKYKAGILNAEESARLSAILKEEDGNKSLNEIMNEFWENSGEEVIPSDKVWKKIDSNIEDPQRPTIKMFTNVLKYVAVISVTILTTWFAKSYVDSSKQISNTGLDTEKYNEVSVSFGSKSRIILPDGSVVILNSGSKLRYPAQFESASRNVYLEGEGFFEVQKNEKHPFLVKTKDITIRVLGTRFNVKSYDDEKTVETTLVSGKVEILANGMDKSKNQKPIVLKPNEQALFYKDSRELSLNKNDSLPGESNPLANKPVRINSKVDIVQVTSWKDNRLSFRNEKFTDLAVKLERWYDVKIYIKDEALKEILFSGTFQKESIEQALNALKLIIPFKYEMKMNQIVITKI